MLADVRPSAMSEACFAMALNYLYVYVCFHQAGSQLKLTHNWSGMVGKCAFIAQQTLHTASCVSHIHAQQLFEVHTLQVSISQQESAAK